MNRLVRLSICVSALVAIASVAEAATVDVVLTANPFTGTWALTAQASLGDNFGIAGYNIEIVGSDHAISLGPHATNQAGFKAMGFTVNNADFDGDGAVFAGQNSTDVASLIRGIGQTPWAAAFDYFPGSEIASDDTPTIPYGVPVMLAKGTFTPEPGAGCVPLSFGQSTKVNVWSADAGADAERADVNAVTVCVPEPASFAILGVALLGLVGFRRRR